MPVRGRPGDALGGGAGVEAGGSRGEERVEVLRDGVVDRAARKAEEVWWGGGGLRIRWVARRRER